MGAVHRPYADVFLDPKSAYRRNMRDDLGGTTLNPICIINAGYGHSCKLSYMVALINTFCPENTTSEIESQSLENCGKVGGGCKTELKFENVQRIERARTQ